MAEQIIQIESILGGKSPSKYFSQEQQFIRSIAIDTDMPATDSEVDPCGFVRPTAMEKFSGGNVTGVPIWIVPQPKTEKAYVISNDGKVHSLHISADVVAYSAVIQTLSNCNGNGATFYKDGILVARTGDVAFFSPLSNSPSWQTKLWTSGLAQTAMANPTLPSINGVAMPNHVMHNHVDDAVYITDYINNVGYLHKIKLDSSLDNDGSEYKAIDFQMNMRPTCIATWDDNLVVGLIEGISVNIRQRSAKLGLWDTVSVSFSDITPDNFNDPLITALKNINGIVYVFSGESTGGCRISVLQSVRQLQEIAYIPDCPPPLAGAVDAMLDRIILGGYVTVPEAAGCVHAYGSAANLETALHNILRATGAGANPMVTAVKYLDMFGGSKMQPIIGWKDDSNKGLDRLSATYGNYNVWQSPMYRVGKPFNINRVIIPLVQAIATNMTLIIKFFDMQGNQIQKDGSNYTVTVNSTLLPNNEKEIDISPGLSGHNGFYMQLEWAGTVLLTVGLPITIVLDVQEV